MEEARQKLRDHEKRAQNPVLIYVNTLEREFREEFHICSKLRVALDGQLLRLRCRADEVRRPRYITGVCAADLF